MPKKIPLSHWGIAVTVGAVWGLSEAALGMGLRSCASLVSGAIMTGVALFFLAAAWTRTSQIIVFLLVVIIACLFKMFDALLLSFPIQHGAVANPIFAFWLEGIGFLFFVSLWQSLRRRLGGQALLGGLSALLACGLFPLVKFVTGIPACVFPGTSIPLAIYYSPLAVVLSAVTVPLGFWVGRKVGSFESQAKVFGRTFKLSHIVSPAALILSLAIITLIRL